MGSVNVSLELSYSELNELYYASSKNIDRAVDAYYSRPCAYTKQKLDLVYDLHNKLGKAMDKIALEDVDSITY